MALRHLASNPAANLHLLPCTITYSAVDLFPSRVVVTFEKPIQVPQLIIDTYASGNKTAAAQSLIRIMEQKMQSQVFLHPDPQMLSVRNERSLISFEVLTEYLGR